jgi:mRNA interferase YafQ
MLKDIKWQNQFKRDYRLMIKQGRNISILQTLINDLFKEIPLPPNYRDHKLTGNYVGYRECHVAGTGDWLLIYKIEERVLVLARTGTHSELFE